MRSDRASTAYIDGVINAMSDEDFDFLVTHHDMLDIPTYDALVFGGAGDSFYDLTKHAAQLKNTFRDVKKFWDIERPTTSSCMAMHGAVLLTPDKDRPGACRCSTTPLPRRLSELRRRGRRST